MSSVAAAALRERLERDPDATLLSNTTDRVLSIGSDVWRLRWRGQLTAAVAADADLSTTCGALLDVLALLELELGRPGIERREQLVDLSVVNVIVDRPLPGEAPSETDEALRSLRDAVVGVTARVWYQRDTDGWIEDVDAAPTWAPDDARITKWVHDLLLPRLTTEPTQLALDLLAAVDDPSLHLYPSHIKAWAPPRWAVRIDGLEIGVIGSEQGTLTVGRPGAAGDSAQRKAFVEVFGHPAVIVKGQANETDVLDLLAAATKIRVLLRRFRAVDVRGAPITHRSKDGIPFVDEHALESRLLKGIVPALEGTGLVRGDSVVARGSQFPTLWGQASAPRYLDALLTRGETPVAVELKVATSGQGRNYRRSLVQAVLYAHFIRNAQALQAWFDRANLRRTAVLPVIGMPAPLRWTPDWDRRLESLRAVARRVGAEVWVLDDRVTPDWEVHIALAEPDETGLERHSWRLAAALSMLWPRSLGHTVDTWPHDGFYDMIELRNRDDVGLGASLGRVRIAMNRPGSLWVFGPTGADRWTWRGVWNHLAAGGDLREAATIIGSMAGLPAEPEAAVTFPCIAAAFLDAIDEPGWAWRCAWPAVQPNDIADRFRRVVGRYRAEAPRDETLPTRSRLWAAVRDGHAAVVVDQHDLRTWAWHDSGPIAMTQTDPIDRIRSAAGLASHA
jgi:hypothetical protein